MYDQLIYDKDTTAIQWRKDFLCPSNQPGPIMGTRGREGAEKGDDGGRGLTQLLVRGAGPLCVCVCVCVCVCEQLPEASKAVFFPQRDTRLLHCWAEPHRIKGAW